MIDFEKEIDIWRGSGKTLEQLARSIAQRVEEESIVRACCDYSSGSPCPIKRLYAPDTNARKIVCSKCMGDGWVYDLDNDCPGCGGVGYVLLPDTRDTNGSDK